MCRGVEEPWKGHERNESETKIDKCEKMREKGEMCGRDKKGLTVERDGEICKGKEIDWMRDKVVRIE